MGNSLAVPRELAQPAGRITRADMGDSALKGRVLLDTSFSVATAVAKGARRDDVKELDDLQQLGDGYAVYVSPTR